MFHLVIVLLEVKLSQLDWWIDKIVSDKDRLTDKLPDKRPSGEQQMVTTVSANASSCAQ